MTKDYSRKPYRTKKSYPEMIRYTPARAFWNSVTEQLPVFSEYGAQGRFLTALERRYLQYLAQSEAKKPYLSDDYETMEEVWEGLPGLQDDENWSIDHPWMPDPQPTRIDDILPVEPQEFILFAFTEDEFCIGDTQTITINATYPIYELEFTFPGLLQPGTNFVILSGLGTPVVQIDLTVDINETQNPISMRAFLEAADAPPPPSTQGRGFTGFGIFEGSIDDCCTFQFTLSGSDGPTFDGSYNVVFRVFRPSGTSLAPISYQYRTDINAWCVKIQEEIDPLGYWVEYSINGLAIDPTTHAVRTQYPFKYKTADKLQVVDRINPGAYSDTLHYYEEIDENIWEPVDTDLGTTPPGCVYAESIRAFFHEKWFDIISIHRRLKGHGSAKVLSRVRATVEYRVRYVLYDSRIDVEYFSPYILGNTLSCASRPECGTPPITWTNPFCTYARGSDSPYGSDLTLIDAWDINSSNDTGDINVDWIPSERTDGSSAWGGGGLSTLRTSLVGTDFIHNEDVTGDMSIKEHYIDTIWPNLLTKATSLTWDCCFGTPININWYESEWVAIGPEYETAEVTVSILF